jgi:hypothetical protein
MRAGTSLLLDTGSYLEQSSITQCAKSGTKPSIAAKFLEDGQLEGGPRRQGIRSCDTDSKSGLVIEGRAASFLHQKKRWGGGLNQQAAALAPIFPTFQLA